MRPSASCAKLNAPTPTLSPPALRSSEALHAFVQIGLEIFGLTKIPGSNPYAATEKLLGIAEHFPELHDRVIISPDKGCVVKPRDYLVDDRPEWANAEQFPGTVVKFKGDWPSVVEQIRIGMRIRQAMAGAADLSLVPITSAPASAPVVAQTRVSPFNPACGSPTTCASGGSGTCTTMALSTSFSTSAMAYASAENRRRWAARADLSRAAARKAGAESRQVRHPAGSGDADRPQRGALGGRGCSALRTTNCRYRCTPCDRRYDPSAAPDILMLCGLKGPVLMSSSRLQAATSRPSTLSEMLPTGLPSVTAVNEPS